MRVVGFLIVEEKRNDPVDWVEDGEQHEVNVKADHVLDPVVLLLLNLLAVSSHEEHCNHQ